MTSTSKVVYKERLVNAVRFDEMAYPIRFARFCVGETREIDA
jgi:hypothetical protein